ncbi:MAG: CbiQ family ECF transporter T component [Actinomycetota bacterium]
MTRLPRRLHAGAWWLWAIGLLAAATMTTNPVLLATIIAVCALAVAARRSGSAWATGFGAYLLLAGVVMAVRVGFRILLGGDMGDHVLFRLPSLSLPQGTVLGGAVTTEEILAGSYDGLRLGAIVVCVGAANSLADPRRLVGSLPRALGALSTSVVVAISLAPQLIESVGRVRRARRLRGESGGGWKALRSLLVPILEDSLHRSLALAASMDSRGYGRWEPAAAGRGSTRALAWSGPAAICAGMFWLLTAPGWHLPLLLIVAGAAATGAGLRRIGSGTPRTRYRPDPWEGPEWAVAASGMIAAAAIAAMSALSPSGIHPSVQPLGWPEVPPAALAAVLVAAFPSVAAPSLPRAPAMEGTAP